LHGPVDGVLEEALCKAEQDELKNPAAIGFKLRGITLTRLQDARERKGIISQRQISRALGRNHDYAGALERGSKGVIGLHQVREISEILGVYPSDLIDADSLRDYLTPENSKIHNLRPKVVSNGTVPDANAAATYSMGVGGILGNVFTFFKRKRARTGIGRSRGR
jgi:transcriptional regulator with XRE-family HTH domain